MSTKLKEAISANCTYSAGIVTNGFFLTREVAEKLVECNVNHVQVTIDGSKQIHDSRRVLYDGSPTYESIIQNLCNCADVIKIVVRINVDKNSVSNASEILDTLEQKGLKKKVGLYLAPVDNFNETCTGDIHCLSMQEFSQEEASFYEQAVDRGFEVSLSSSFNPAVCGAISLNSYVIDPQGYLYKCWEEIGDKKHSVGNVATDHIELNNRLTKWLTYEPISSACAGCAVLPACMGGCPYRSLDNSEKRCSAIRYNIKQRILLQKRLHHMKTSVENVESGN